MGTGFRTAFRPVIAVYLAIAGFFGVLAAPVDAQVVTLGGDNAAPSDVVAQGVATLPKGDVVWRVVRANAGSMKETKPQDTDTGFVVAGNETIVVSDMDAQSQVLLGQNEATWVPGGSQQQRAVPSGSSATYTEISLVAKDAGDAAGDGSLVFAGDAFNAPSGSRDIQLSTATMARSQTLAIQPDNGQALVFVAAGSVSVSTGGDLGSGDAQTYDGDVTLTNNQDDSARVYVASIGDTVPGLPTFTGSATLEVKACPDGTWAGSFNPSDCKAVSGDAGFGVSLLNQDLNPIDTTDTLSDGTMTWTGLDYGTYLWGAPTLPAPYVGTLWTDANSKALDRAEVTIGESSLNVTTILYVFPVSYGTISVTVLNCPPGMSNANLDGSECQTPSPDDTIAIQLSGPDGTVYDGSDYQTGTGQYSFSGLPVDNSGAAYGLVESSLPKGYDDYTYYGDSADDFDSNGNILLTSANNDLALTIYNFRPAASPSPSASSSRSSNPSSSPSASANAGGTGSITVAVYGCPPGVSPGDSASYASCQAVAGDVTAQLITPQGDALTSGGSGTARFGGLPFGTYSLTLTSVPSGYSGPIAPGYAGTSGSPDRVNVTVSADNPDPVVTVYVFQS